MSWFAIDTELEGHPKFHDLLSRRHWTADRGLAFLYRFWRTVRDHAVTGDVSDWSDAYLGSLTSVGRPLGLLNDLVACGFVDLENDRLVVHDWMSRNGHYIVTTTANLKSVGGRRGGSTRAATGLRDAATGRYATSVDNAGGKCGPHIDHTSVHTIHSNRRLRSKDSDASSPDGEDLSPVATITARPVQEPDTPAPANPLAVVHALATVKALGEKPPDPRGALWDLCRQCESEKASAEQLMGIASWLWFTQGKHDLDLITAVLSKLSVMRNPYACLQPGGKAIERLIGEVSVARAERQAREHRDADRGAGLARGP